MNAILVVATALILLLNLVNQAGAQSAPVPVQTATPAAPLPALLSNTRTVFLANAGDQENADCLAAYNAFYTDLQQLGRFTLVDTPAQADMVVELHYEIAIGQGRDSNAPRQFRVALIDPKAHILLWSLTERTNYAGLRKNRDKDLKSAIDALVNDFTSLVSSKPVPPSNKSKVHH